jgi:hypothetical protein
MQKITNVFEDFTKSFTESAQAQMNPLAHAVSLLSLHPNLTDGQQLELAEYLGNNTAQAIIFSNFPQTTREVWLQKTLDNLEQAKARPDSEDIF